MITPPLPVPDADTQPYWDALARGELRIQRCRACRRFQHFPSPVCSACCNLDLEFEPVSGHGRIESFVVVHHITSPAFADSAPYPVAWVELPEQPHLRVLGNVIDCPVSQISVGMPVDFVVDQLDSRSGALLRFRPRQEVSPR